TLADALPSPVWARATGGELTYVTSAYARAVEASAAEDAIARGLDLLGRAARDESIRVRGSGRAYAERLPAVIAGQRRIGAVLNVPTRRGSAGIAIDVTETQSMRTELARMVEAHRRTLDQ